jgi:NADH:ubiquinone oxidoreductase subunit 5 (subunit L)/multisubunit Na+/H+ antiporter MnhA subunit
VDGLVILIPLLSLLAAALVGFGIMSGYLQGEAKEGLTAMMVNWSMSMVCLLIVSLEILGYLDRVNGSIVFSSWLISDTLDFRHNFITRGFALHTDLVFSIILLVTGQFSVNYLHREPGYHRFFFVLSLFAFAIHLLLLSGNLLGTFIGWEIAGLSSYFLIAYAYDRPNAALNATRVFVTNRIGDAGFVLGIALSYLWLESSDWPIIKTGIVDLTKGESATIGLCFLTAAFVKSAQLPFSPWLLRSMEGPTPSSAVFYGGVMIHAGVFLVIRLQPLIEQTPLAIVLLLLTGAATVIFSYLSGLTQTDVKSSHAFATIGQLGLMFVECGMGWWQLASWHLWAHAVFRCYLILTAPSFIANTMANPVKPAPQMLMRFNGLFIASLQRFWIEQLSDWAMVRPIGRLGHDLSYFDDYIVDKIMGVPVPAIQAVSTLAQIEELALAPSVTTTGADISIKNVGLLGLIVHWFSGVVHWFEDRLVLQGVSRDVLDAGRKIGYLANQFELMILRPRYLVLFVVITLLMAF